MDLKIIFHSHSGRLLPLGRWKSVLLKNTKLQPNRLLTLDLQIHNPITVSDLRLACSIDYWFFLIDRDLKVSREQLEHLVFLERKEPQVTQVLREKGENRSVNNILYFMLLNDSWSVNTWYFFNIVIETIECIQKNAKKFTVQVPLL